MNVGTLIIAALVLLAVFFAVRSIWKRRKQGGCAGCPNCAACVGTAACTKQGDGKNQTSQ